MLSTFGFRCARCSFTHGTSLGAGCCAPLRQPCIGMVFPTRQTPLALHCVVCALRRDGPTTALGASRRMSQY